MMGFVSERIENVTKKGENAHNQQFFLFVTFSKCIKLQLI